MIMVRDHGLQVSCARLMDAYKSRLWCSPAMNCFVKAAASCEDRFRRGCQSQLSLAGTRAHSLRAAPGGEKRGKGGGGGGGVVGPLVQDH